MPLRGGEFMDHLGAEGRQIVGFVQRNQAPIDDNLFVNPVGAGIAQIRFQ